MSVTFDPTIHVHRMMTVIVHVGCNNLKETCELVRHREIADSAQFPFLFFFHLYSTQAMHAQEIGADAIGVMPPVFFKPANIGKFTCLSGTSPSSHCTKKAYAIIEMLSTFRYYGPVGNYM